MNTAITKRGITLTVAALTFLIALGSVVWACVPQRGTLVVEATTDDLNGTTTTTSSKIIGDGTQDNHWQGWCEQPTDAAYAGNGDEVTVTVDEASAGESNGCPDSANSLPEGDNDIWVENGITNGDEDVYVWNEQSPCPSSGCWNFPDGDGVGCYKDDGGADPVHQGTVAVDSNGSGQKTFTLQGMQNTNTNPDNDTDGSTNEDDPNEPNDDASLICVGDDIDDPDPVAIFAPLVVTSV